MNKNYRKKIEQLKTMEPILIENPIYGNTIFSPTNVLCPKCGDFIYTNQKYTGLEWYCDNCGTGFWYNKKAKHFTKQNELFWEHFINNQFCKIKKNSVIKMKIMSLINKIKSRLGICILLKEGTLYSIKESKYKIIIRSDETNHQIPHFHFEHGKNVSIGYSIENFEPLGIEKNCLFKKHPKSFTRFLEQAYKWYTEKGNNNLTGKQALMLYWNMMKNK